MTTIRNMFSIYIVAVMLIIGLYMTVIASGNLIHVDNMQKEGRFTKVIGWFYILFAIVGFVIITL